MGSFLIIVYRNAEMKLKKKGFLKNLDVFQYGFRNERYDAFQRSRKIRAACVGVTWACRQLILPVGGTGILAA